MSEATSRALGVVVIGRNEGERLARCLRSVVGRSPAVAYVDSGSSDGSVALARSLGAEVVELDRSRPFSAGRARNAGFERLLSAHPGLACVQFVDGDCELQPGWLERARGELASRDDVAIVCGRRRERSPRASRYNRLCDIEWDRPAGDVDACGGDFLARVEAFREVGGFDPAFVAGEEPELCLRLRERGWRIRRLSAEMTLHDAGLTAFSQWWTRVVRSGHACAQTAWVHPRRSGRLGTRSLASIALWTLLLPAAALGLAAASGGLGLLLLAAYPLQGLRIARGQRAAGRSRPESRLYAAAVLIGKFAQALGVLRFLAARVRRRPGEILEYKTAPSGTGGLSPDREAASRTTASRGAAPAASGTPPTSDGPSPSR